MNLWEYQKRGVSQKTSCQQRNKDRKPRASCLNKKAREVNEDPILFSQKFTPNDEDFVLRDFSRKKGAYVWVRHFQS